MRFFAVALFFFGAASYGQTPEVPHKMQFAGMTLTIRDDARREIQKDVDAFTKYPRYFGVKVERAKTYFPLIEKIFEEERLPDDFKYLVLQESALISDAVSVSNAVGFWQFKDFTALEMGLRVDKEVDERMHIISSTRAAAKYIKQNNYMFNNWLYALQAYQMGAGGVQRSVGDQHNGAKHMEITSETYWYVKKYLAHKVAFEDALRGEAQLKVIPFETNSSKSVSDLAQELSVEEARLLEFNKWIRNGRVPSDKSYTVLIPVGEVEDFNRLKLAASAASVSAAAREVNASGAAKVEVAKGKEKPEEIWINDVPVIKAAAGETVSSLSNRAQVDISSFIKYNDISIDHVLRAGGFYFLEKKRNKSQREFYKTESNLDIWAVSQQTGVQMKKLMKYNGWTEGQAIPAGSTIWLNGPKPKDNVMPVTDQVALVDDEEFDWTVKPENETGKPTEKAVVMSTEISAVIDTALTAKAGSQTEYVVKQGETLYAIARNNQVEVVHLLAWNQLTISDGLKPGQVLKLYDPVGSIDAAKHESLPVPQEVSSKADVTQLHEVQASDTLYSVARKYGVTIKEIMDWNEKTDLSLTVGEKLRIIQR